MTNDKPNLPTEAEADLDALVQRLQKLGRDMDRHANEEWDEHEDVFAAVNAITALRAQHADHEAEIARLTAERDAAMAGAVKVKPLVWAPYDASTHHYNGPTGRLMHTRATCAGLDYSLEREEHPASEFYGKWFVMRGLTLRLAGPFPTDISAKDWCQADYEARIRAAIQPDPDARQADLEKAWEMATAAIAERAKIELSAAWAADLIAQWAQSLTPPADLAPKIGGAE